MTSASRRSKFMRQNLRWKSVKNYLAQLKRSANFARVQQKTQTLPEMTARIGSFLEIQQPIGSRDGNFGNPDCSLQVVTDFHRKKFAIQRRQWKINFHQYHPQILTRERGYEFFYEFPRRQLRRRFADLLTRFTSHFLHSNLSFRASCIEIRRKFRCQFFEINIHARDNANL